MSRVYEMMVVFGADLGPDDVPAKMEGLRSLVGEHGGTVTDVIDWGRRRLAYPIQRNFEGHYVITAFTSETGAGNRGVERALSIDESVLRYLIVRKDE